MNAFKQLTNKQINLQIVLCICCGWGEGGDCLPESCPKLQAIPSHCSVSGSSFPSPTPWHDGGWRLLILSESVLTQRMQHLSLLRYRGKAWCSSLKLFPLCWFYNRGRHICSKAIPEAEGNFSWLPVTLYGCLFTELVEWLAWKFIKWPRVLVASRVLFACGWSCWRPRWTLE